MRTAKIGPDLRLLYTRLCHLSDFLSAQSTNEHDKHNFGGGMNFVLTHKNNVAEQEQEYHIIKLKSQQQ